MHQRRRDPSAALKSGGRLKNQGRLFAIADDKDMDTKFGKIAPSKKGETQKQVDNNDNRRMIHTKEKENLTNDSKIATDIPFLPAALAQVNIS